MCGEMFFRSKKALPMSPHKKLAVVAGLASDVGLNLETKMEGNLKNLRGLSEEAKFTARDFFFQPDISYTMPGLNDVVTVWDDSGKKKLRKYYFTMFLREAHEVYCQTQDNPASFSTFCNLHPKTILLLADSPKDQYRCLIHENIFLELDAMGISYDSSLKTKVLCSINDNIDCWNSKCDDCKNGKKLVPMKLLNATTNLRQ